MWRIRLRKQNLKQTQKIKLLPDVACPFDKLNSLHNIAKKLNILWAILDEMPKKTVIVYCENKIRLNLPPTPSFIISQPIW